MHSLDWLSGALRDAGLKVVEEPGWRDRGRPGPFGPVKGVLVHHTGSNPKGGNAPDIGTVTQGRGPPNPLAGPLAQLLLARDGTFHVIAAGRANHAGTGFWHGIADGNAQMVGIEAENNGVDEDWPADQMDALARGCAAILLRVGSDSVMCAGHKEYATPRGRKVDPDFDMAEFRERVAQIMAGRGTAAAPAVKTDPRRSMLRKGDQGQSVTQLQELLGITTDGSFGPRTDLAVRRFQSEHGLKPDGLVGPATWLALGH